MIKLKGKTDLEPRQKGLEHPLLDECQIRICQFGKTNPKSIMDDEGEDVEAVIQVIVPGTKLKSYLESRVDMTLQALRHILRTYYIVKDATELYQ